MELASEVLSLVEKPTPRELLTTTGLTLAVAAAAFSVGRFTAPVQVEERVEYRTEWREKKVEVVKWRTARAVDTRTTTTPVLLQVPDGGVVLASSTTTESRERETGSGGVETKTDASSATAGQTQRVTTVRPDWRVGVLAGASLREPAVVLTGPLVIGASVERRIAGGLSLGVWANTVGAAGASLSMEF